MRIIITVTAAAVASLMILGPSSCPDLVAEEQLPAMRRACEVGRS